MVALSGGAKLEAVLKGIAEKASNAASVEIGWVADGATFPDGTSVALVAALNEFGRPDHNQPPRPFFRTMIVAKSGEWPDAVAGLLKANDYDAAKALGLTGQVIAGQLQESIVDFTSPPLSPVTVKAKGFDKPLVDSGQMLKEIKFVVR